MSEFEIWMANWFKYNIYSSLIGAAILVGSVIFVLAKDWFMNHFGT